MMLILAFICLAGALALAGQLVTSPQRARQQALRRTKAYLPHDDEPTRDERFERLASRYGPSLARLAMRIDPRSTEERVGLKLVAAGLAKTISPTGYLALKVVAGATGAAVGALLSSRADTPLRALIVVLVLAAVGFLLPDLYVNGRARSRRTLMQRQLPDALDILAVSVEAGLGFDAAITKLSQHMDGPLVEQFLLVLGELRIGETRANALRKMAERNDLAELTSVVTSLIQAEQLGSPLGDMLRVQAGEARYRRQVAAEERAMKAPVKMILPTGLCIFPAMFIVIIAPAVLEITRAF
jgi:tight adherence protein C